MNRLDKRYQDLLQDILDNGVVKTDRTGTGTISVFGRQIRHRMAQGFPLLTTKKMAWNVMVAELLWFLRGETNIKFLLDYDCHIWDGDAYKNFVNKVDSIWQKSAVGDLDDMIYDGLLIDGTDENGKWFARIPTKEEFIGRIKSDVEFAKIWGELGPIYGKQWRDWEIYNNDDGSPYRDVDQITNLINELKTNPDSRRLMVSAWNVSELDHMVLPPCHYGFQVYTRKLTGEEMWVLLKKKVGEEKFQSMVDDIVPFGGGLSEELESYKIPKRAISLMWNQRSVDTFLGLPFNIASYGLLLEILGMEVNMVPEDLIGNLGDVHLYSNHLEHAKEQINREPFKNLPVLKFSPIPLTHFEHHMETFDKFIRNSYPHQFIIEGYECHPTIKAPLSN
jgi:thymidylate synthase